jgi:transcription initiation factor IIE alpha subunit
MALAWQAEEHAKCPTCGNRVEETTSDDVGWSAEAVVCHACEAVARKRRQVNDNPAVHAGDGLLVYPVRED